MSLTVKAEVKGFLAISISPRPGSLPVSDRLASGDPFQALLEMQQN